ncbi:Mfa1 family fimbria major subunit [Parabacteroides johnsonii]|uniref:Mfa1 family fimbria major subunit n=1 Tax=Parabacteroides johnsonii TaxID=387661 RepID=UPI001898BAC3|nr:Mfa1 family fimbria major subunit [Parabacteroides johnsonii]
MKVKNYLWTLAAALALVGCSDDLETQKGGPEEGTEQAEGTLYVDFSFGMPETKTPTGGEDGDGFEVGSAEENNVKDATLFFIATEITPSDRPTLNKADKYLGAVYIPENSWKEASNGSWTLKEAVKISKEVEDQIIFGKQYGVLAVVNGGDLTKLVTDIASLRNAVAAGEIAVANEFLMASEDDAVIVFEKTNNSVKNPAYTKIDVERVTARIDYKAIMANNTYTLYAQKRSGEADTKAKFGEVQLTDIAVVNQMNENANSYWFKRVAENFDDPKYDYLGVELPIPSGNPQTNYVFDPYTTSKTLDKEGMPTWPCVNAQGQPVYTNRVVAYDEEAGGSYWKQAGIKFTEFTTLDASGAAKDLNQYRLVCYTKENTTSKVAQKNGYSTGVVFKATAKITSAYQRTAKRDDDNNLYYNGYVLKALNADAPQFFLYDNKPFATLADIQQLFVEREASVQPEEGSESSPIIATGWAFDVYGERELQHIANRGQNEANRQYCLEKFEYYVGSFSSFDFGYRKHLDKIFEDAQKEDFDWTKIVDLANWKTWAEEYEKNLAPDAAADQYGIRKSSTNTMTCYYPYWIRHSDNNINAGDGTGDDGDEIMGIMEFGIVRNNIYKLSVKTIKNFGIDELDPGIDDEASDLYLNVELSVKPWVLRFNENIEL